MAWTKVSDILRLSAVVYHNCIGGIGYIRGVCDVVCWGSGDMYGNRVKEGRRRPESQTTAKVKSIFSINETGGKVKCIGAVNANMNLKCRGDITNTIQRA